MFNIKKFHPLKLRQKMIHKSMSWRITDIVTLSLMTFATLALLSLVYFYLRPIKTVDIKVPVATDRSTYAPGEDISGIFFGETFYTGRVKVLREVFCTNYKATITPPNGANDDGFYATISTPRKLEGVTVPIGTLPMQIPIGANCVLRFTNLYEIQTPFGIRRIEKFYYTQNFAIISQERRNILDCEAAGGTDCSKVTDTKTSTNNSNTGAISPKTNNVTNNTTNNSTTNNTTNNDIQSPPAEIPEECTATILFIKLGCN